MQFTTLLMFMLVAALLMVLSAPVSEATFLLFACMVRSPYCPWITTPS